MKLSHVVGRYDERREGAGGHGLYHKINVLGGKLKPNPSPRTSGKMAEFVPYKVLIVDDHLMARQLVHNVMKEIGVQQIVMAADGREAREALYAAYDAGQPFDIVFLDWNMPDVEGIDVLKHFRTHPEFAITAFIMLTAESGQGEVLHAAKSGATSYIVKPASREVIIKKFNETVAWGQKQMANSSGLHLPPRKK